MRQDPEPEGAVLRALSTGTRLLGDFEGDGGPVVGRRGGRGEREIFHFVKEGISARNRLVKCEVLHLVIKGGFARSGGQGAHHLRLVVPDIGDGVVKEQFLSVACYPCRISGREPGVTWSAEALGRLRGPRLLPQSG